MTIVADILSRAYALAPLNLDHVAQTLHDISWSEMVQGLNFQPWDTGGGCMMLLATTPWQSQVGITNGDEGLPVDAESFWVGIMPADDTVELYALQVQAGRIEWHSGELS